MDQKEAMKKQLEADIEGFQNEITRISYQAGRQIKDFQYLIEARKKEISDLDTPDQAPA